VVRRGLIERRLVKVEDVVKKKHHRRTNDEVERDVDGLKVIILRSGGWLTAELVTEDPDRT
jgi:hypothetical protein